MNYQSPKKKQRRQSLFESNKKIRTLFDKKSSTKRNSFVRGLEEIQFIKKYFEAIKQSSPQDIKFIKDAILTDPRQLSCGNEHSSRRTNVKNFDGEFPLYLASKYNHVFLLDFLIQCKYFYYLKIYFKL